MQHALKAPSGATWAGVVAPQLLDQLLLAMHHADADFDITLRGIPAPALAHRRKSSRPVVL